MPLTPFHLGPGLAVKAISGRHFSLMVFAFSQIAMDLEPIVHMIRGDVLLHGFVHTYAGATLVAIVSVILGRPICQRLLDPWPPGASSRLMKALRGPPRISWPAAIAAAFFGTYSHVFLDSIMHADMQPFAPVASANPMLNVISTRALHLLCVACGLAGGALIVALSRVRRDRRDAPGDRT